MKEHNHPISREPYQGKVAITFSCFFCQEGNLEENYLKQGCFLDYLCRATFLSQTLWGLLELVELVAGVWPEMDPTTGILVVAVTWGSSSRCFKLSNWNRNSCTLGRKLKIGMMPHEKTLRIYTYCNLITHNSNWVHQIRCCSSCTVLFPFIAIATMTLFASSCEDKSRMQRPSMDALPWMGQWVSIFCFKALSDKRRLQKVQIQSVQIPNIIYQNNFLVGGFNPFEKYVRQWKYNYLKPPPSLDTRYSAVLLSRLHHK